MGRVLSSFQDTKPFYEIKEVGHTRGFLINITEYTEGL